MSKINILVVPSDTIGGVGYYRSVQPHVYLDRHYGDEFSVTINPNPDWKNLESFDNYDIIHIHKGLYDGNSGFLGAMAYFKNKGIITVMDIDDHFRLDFRHSQFASQKFYKTDETIKKNFTLFDYITTTTPIFADEIKKFNPNTYVFPNAIDPKDPQFSINKTKSDRIRIGLIMGSSHEHDMELLRGLTNKLKNNNILEKVQFVLCGFDLRGSVRMIDNDTGKVQERNIEPKETVWYRYEQNLTDDYRLVSPQYKDFLLRFSPNSEWNDVEQECYRRCWTKDMSHYYSHYNNVDILLAPLETTEFNKVKSQLKVIECCFSKTAIIASDFGPYKLDINSMFGKNNTFDENGNGVLIDETRNHKDWFKAITKLVNNPELITTLQNNLYNSLHNKYSLETVVQDRAEFYKKIYKNINH